MKEYPEISLSWSEPGLGFRLTFTKTTYKETGEKATDSDRLRPVETRNQDEKRTIADDAESKEFGQCLSLIIDH